jgi:uncharacterized protein YndB with AHSA1/START domain
MECIERTIVLPAPPDRIWSALTGPDEISAWFGAEVEFEPRPGAPARFRWPDGWERGAVVESVEPPSRLCFRWMPFELGPDQKMRPVHPGRVEFRLQERPGGTELIVTEWIQLAGGMPHPSESVGPGTPQFSTRGRVAQTVRLGSGAGR